MRSILSYGAEFIDHERDQSTLHIDHKFGYTIFPRHLILLSSFLTHRHLSNHDSRIMHIGQHCPVDIPFDVRHDCDTNKTWHEIPRPFNSREHWMRTKRATKYIAVFMFLCSHDWIGAWRIHSRVALTVANQSISRVSGIVWGTTKVYVCMRLPIQSLRSHTQLHPHVTSAQASRSDHIVWHAVEHWRILLRVPLVQ